MDLADKYLQRTPHRDELPFFTHPTADDGLVAARRSACKKVGVEIAPPDPVLREAAVRSWKRAGRISVDLGVNQMNTAFSGPPAQPGESQAAFYRFMEDLVPLIERIRTMTRLPRNFMLIPGLIGTAGSLAATTVALRVVDEEELCGFLVLFRMVTFLAAVQSCIGSVNWPTMSEIFPQSWCCSPQPSSG